MKNLKDLTKEEYKKLDKAGMLYVLYPEATGDYLGDTTSYNDHIITEDSMWLKVDGKVCYYPRHSLIIGINLNIEKPAPSEIEAHLIEEAKRRGYKKGTTIKSIADYQQYTLCDDYFSYEPANDSLHGSNYTIYWNGKWSDIIKDEAIKIGGYDVEFKEGCFKVGCKTIKNSFTETLIILINQFQQMDLHKISIDYKGNISIEEGGDDYSISKEDFIKLRSKLFYKNA